MTADLVFSINHNREEHIYQLMGTPTFPTGNYLACFKNTIVDVEEVADLDALVAGVAKVGLCVHAFNMSQDFGLYDTIDGAMDGCAEEG